MVKVPAKGMVRSEYSIRIGPIMGLRPGWTRLEATPPAWSRWEVRRLPILRRRSCSPSSRRCRCYVATDLCDRLRVEQAVVAAVVHAVEDLWLPSDLSTGFTIMNCPH